MFPKVIILSWATIETTVTTVEYGALCQKKIWLGRPFWCGCTGIGAIVAAGWICRELVKEFRNEVIVMNRHTRLGVHQKGISTVGIIAAIGLFGLIASASLLLPSFP